MTSDVKILNVWQKIKIGRKGREGGGERAATVEFINSIGLQGLSLFAKLKFEHANHYTTLLWKYFTGGDNPTNISQDDHEAQIR